MKAELKKSFNLTLGLDFFNSDEGKCLYETIMQKALPVIDADLEANVLYFYIRLERLPMKNGKSRLLIKLPIELWGDYIWKSLPQITADIFLSIIYPNVFVL